MRIALLFPPQWDPRQPPLSVATLSGFLKGKNIPTRAWDFNLELYQKLLISPQSGGVEEFLLKKYRDPALLSSIADFEKITGLLQQQFHERYDPRGEHKLFWDTLIGPVSPNRSSDWRAVLDRPELVPAIQFLRSGIAEVTQWDPALIAISSLSDTQVLCGLALAGMFRKRLPKAMILIGGHPFKFRQSLLKESPWLFDTLDGIGLFSGEETLQALAENLPMKEAPNLLWSDGKKIHVNPLKTFRHGFPPDYSDVHLPNYLTPALVMPISTASGCPWGKCVFCNHPNHPLPEAQQYQPRAQELVFRELQDHVAAGRRRFFFVDEALAPDRLRELIAGMVAHNLEISWICYSRFEDELTAEDFQNARKAGCRKIFFGFETASQRILDQFRKGTSVQAARRNVIDAGKAGIAVHLFIMTGFPGETGEDQQLTLDFLSETLPHTQAFGFTWDLFPLSCELGTPLHASPTEFGITQLQSDPRQDFSYRLGFSPPTMGPVGLANLHGPRAFAEEIKSIVEHHLGPAKGLRHLNLNQDSLHLPLIEAAVPDRETSEPEE